MSLRRELEMKELDAIRRGDSSEARYSIIKLNRFREGKLK